MSGEIALQDHHGHRTRWHAVRSAAFTRLAATGASPQFGAPKSLSTSGPSAYPVLAAVPKGLVAVWTSGPPDKATIAVRVLD